MAALAPAFRLALPAAFRLLGLVAAARVLVALLASLTMLFRATALRVSTPTLILVRCHDPVVERGLLTNKVERVRDKVEKNLFQTLCHPPDIQTGRFVPQRVAGASGELPERVFIGSRMRVQPNGMGLVLFVTTFFIN